MDRVSCVFTHTQDATSRDINFKQTSEVRVDSGVCGSFYLCVYFRFYRFLTTFHHKAQPAAQACRAARCHVPRQRRWFLRLSRCPALARTGSRRRGGSASV